MSLAALEELTIDGFRLSGVHSDGVDGLVVTLADPTVPPDRQHLEGALHVVFADWGYLCSMRPSFAPLARFAVTASSDFVAAQLSRLPDAWFSAAERASMQRVALFDRELATPVLELLAPTVEVRRGPLRPR